LTASPCRASIEEPLAFGSELLSQEGGGGGRVVVSIWKELPMTLWLTNLLLYVKDQTTSPLRVMSRIALLGGLDTF